jgi:signal transduction histidine kinase
MLENIVDVYTAVMENENKTLTSAIAEGLKISGDEELMIQMIANLLENAIKHTPPGASLQVNLKKTNKGLVAEIADDGDGIPEKERHRVFERFYRLERSRTTPGNGLGLALVAAIADLHGAFITLEDNRPGLRVRLRF